MQLRIIPQDRQIYNGNTVVAYIDENDAVYVLRRGEAVRIGTADRFSEALQMVKDYFNDQV
ncbi:hypothetical protein [Rhizobium phage RHph_X2_24]|nr:hypothetical protein [Rhizobium phage RHph_X2_24]